MKRTSSFLIGVLALVFLVGCPTPYVAAQRSILSAVDALKIADTAIVAHYPDVPGTDEERVEWLEKAVCALRVSRDVLQIGWDVTFYWATDGKVCKLDREVVPEGTAGADCVDGERSWQEWVQLSLPVVLHTLQLLEDFGVDIPEEPVIILQALLRGTTVEGEHLDTDFDACVEALAEEEAP